MVGSHLEIRQDHGILAVALGLGDRLRHYSVPSLLLYFRDPLVELTEYHRALILHFSVGVNSLHRLRAVCPSFPLHCAEHPSSLLLCLGDFEGKVC